MNKEIRILIDDGNQIKLGTGIGKYSHDLYNAMKENGYNVTLVEQSIKKLERLKARLIYLKHINSKEYMRFIEKFDIVLYTNYAMPFRKSKITKYAVAIPDMVAYLYPETLPILYRFYNRMMIRNSIFKADLLFTISKSVEDKIITKFPKCKGRISTTWLGLYEGIRPVETYLDYENSQFKGIEQSNFFLFVSTVEKRKNVDFVLDAFILFKKTVPVAQDYKLVIVGRPGLGFDNFVKKANESGLAKDIIFSGYASDSDCNRLYNHAKAFIFPTIYEGFGFAQIECMRCHLPIILSDIPTNREISRDYGEFFQLNDIKSLLSKMEKIANGRYDFEKKAAIADSYLDDFDWNKIARQYYQYISAVCQQTQL